MNVPIPAGMSAAIGRMQEIQSRIDSLNGGNTPPSADDSADTGFATALRDAGQAQTAPRPAAPGALTPAVPTQLIDPAGNLVRSLPPLPTDGQFDEFINQSASKYGVDPALVRAVIQTESGGDAHAISRAGAMGLMQLMPANVSEAGVTDPFSPQQNIDAGTKQLSTLLAKYNGNLDLALAAYNAGPGAVARYGGVPPYAETQHYIQKIKHLMEPK